MLTSCRSPETCACKLRDCPLPNRFACWICAVRDEVLDGREAGADLERAGGPLGDLEVDVDAIGRAPFSVETSTRSK